MTPPPPQKNEVLSPQFFHLINHGSSYATDLILVLIHLTLFFVLLEHLIGRTSQDLVDNQLSFRTWTEVLSLLLSLFVL